MTDVAIMGAGLAGLSCAHYLERHGIEPTIFESRPSIGHRFVNMEAIISAWHRPLKNPLHYLSREYNISFAPGAIVHTIALSSPSHTAVLRGDLGYTNMRGNDERSFERQLGRMVHTKIKFNSKETWGELSRRFDHVVVATGTHFIPDEMGIWSTDVEVYLKGALLHGDFNPGIIKMWLDTNLARQGYVYFAALDQREGYLCAAISPASENEVDTFWERAVEHIKVKPKKGSHFRLNALKIGQPKFRKVDNIYLTGNAGGFIEPALGFGQIPSIMSGLMAAQSIVTGQDYEKLTRWQKRQYHDYLNLRHYLNSLDNKGFDRLTNVLKNGFSGKVLEISTMNPVKILSSAIQVRKTMKFSK